MKFQFNVEIEIDLTLVLSAGLSHHSVHLV